ncbi:MAG: hypothetical protein ACRDVM_05280, partial [Acidimicrobiia bacterium]
MTDAIQVNRDYLREVLTQALAFPSPLSDEAESDPRVVAFIRDFLARELGGLGFQDLSFDRMGNL